MQEKIYKLIKDLDINRPIEDQKNAIKTMITRNDYDIKKLILPLDIRYDIGKKHWENAASVICGKKESTILMIVPDLLIWLQDMNWPGAWKILDRLNSLPKESILLHKENAIRTAKNSNDEIWIDNLNNILE